MIDPQLGKYNLLLLCPLTRRYPRCGVLQMVSLLEVVSNHLLHLTSQTAQRTTLMTSAYAWWATRPAWALACALPAVPAWPGTHKDNILVLIGNTCQILVHSQYSSPIFFQEVQFKHIYPIQCCQFLYLFIFLEGPVSLPSWTGLCHVVAMCVLHVMLLAHKKNLSAWKNCVDI